MIHLLAASIAKDQGTRDWLWPVKGSATVTSYPAENRTYVLNGKQVKNCGEVEQCRFKNNHEAIIDRETFEQVQKKKRGDGTTGASHSYAG